MRLRLLINLSLALSAVLSASAQIAQTSLNFFNSGAQLYISNNIPAALERTENGLKLYPDDVKLKKLEELLKQTRDMLLAAIQMAQEISEETRARDADTSRPGGRSPN